MTQFQFHFWLFFGSTFWFVIVKCRSHLKRLLHYEWQAILPFKQQSNKPQSCIQYNNNATTAATRRSTMHQMRNPIKLFKQTFSKSITMHVPHGTYITPKRKTQNRFENRSQQQQQQQDPKRCPRHPSPLAMKWTHLNEKLYCGGDTSGAGAALWALAK